MKNVEYVIDYVPPAGLSPARWFVSQCGWGRPFPSRQAALEYIDMMHATEPTGLLERLRVGSPHDPRRTLAQA